MVVEQLELVMVVAEGRGGRARREESLSARFRYNCRRWFFEWGKTGPYSGARGYIVCELQRRYGGERVGRHVEAIWRALEGIEREVEGEKNHLA